MSLKKKIPREEEKETSEIISQISKISKKKPEITNNSSEEASFLYDTVFKINCLSKTSCSICSRDISLQIKIICSKCSTSINQFIYCLNCLLGEKHPNHDYYIVDKMNFPLYTLDWPMIDELRLISSIEKYGLDNWGDVSDSMIKRGKVECESHYYTFYFKNKEENLPQKENIILKEINSEGQFEINEEILKKNEELEKKEKEIRTLNQGKVPEPTQQNEKSAKNNGRSVIRGNRNRNGESSIQTAGEILGYWPKREEFDIEFLNDAELEIAELEFLDEDSENDKKLKMDVLRVYNLQLDERKMRKDFIVEKNLLDLKRHNNFESKLSKEDREILNFLKPFARFYDYSEFFDLFEGIVLEKNLKQKLYQLKMYQKQGIKTIEDLQKYLEIDNNKSKKIVIDGNNSNNLNHQVNYEMNYLGERVNRFLKYNNNELLLSTQEQNFIKNFPIPKTTFCDIKEKIDGLQFNSVESAETEINKVLSQYEIEKKSVKELTNFFLTEATNKLTSNAEINNNSSCTNNIINNTLNGTENIKS